MVVEIYEQITSSTLSRVSYLTQNARDDISIFLNSSGGDVFPALSIYNLLKGKVNVEILGLCASSATIIAMAGVKVKMASNALFMIHGPKAMLIDYYDKQSLDKLSNTLAKTEESILSTYRSRVENFQMPAEDLWLTATEAKSLGFVDEIIDEVPIVMDAGNVFINSIAYDAAKVKGLKDRAHPTARKDEALQIILNLIKDQMQSGGQGVSSQSPPTPEDIEAARIQKIVNFANGVV